jgi:hypothetical protein
MFEETIGLNDVRKIFLEQFICGDSEYQNVAGTDSVEVRYRNLPLISATFPKEDLSGPECATETCAIW